MTYLDIHGRRGKVRDLLLQAVSDSREQGGTSRQHDAAVKVLTYINVTLHDAVVDDFMNTS